MIAVMSSGAIAVSRKHPPMLDPERLGSVDPSWFRRRRPYPWVDIPGLLTDEAFARLRAGLPELQQMQSSFGRKRAHGQSPHDRYVLDYSDALPVADAWHELVEALEGPVYRQWLGGLLGTHQFRLNFHWHYTPRGCSVSPHCDARHKLGSHIFYLNTEGDWDASWGGETLVLDDEGRFRRSSAPGFGDFPHRYPSPCIGNRSLLFQRRGNSWHGVEPLRCPDGDHLRKVFIAVISTRGLVGRLRGLAGR
jgi:hypothetical protein